MANAEELAEQVRHVEHGFGPMKRAAEIYVQGRTVDRCISTSLELLKAEESSVRMLGTFILGMVASRSDRAFSILRDHVSRDPSWRVQEILAQAFDIYCAERGYREALPVMEEWLASGNPNLRRAVSEGLRIWTARPYFNDHPEAAVRMLAALRDDESDYVRRSAGNALRDISRAHPALVRSELATWDPAGKREAQVHKLAARFLGEGG